MLVWSLKELNRKQRNKETLGSISPTCYAQLLCAQIPKVQKDSEVTSIFWQVWNIFVQKLLMKHWWNRPQVVASKHWTKQISNFLLSFGLPNKWISWLVVLSVNMTSKIGVEQWGTYLLVRRKFACLTAIFSIRDSNGKAHFFLRKFSILFIVFKVHFWFPTTINLHLQRI